MASNTQLISACALSFVTGVTAAQWMAKPSNKAQKRQKKNGSSSSPSSTSVTSECEEEYNDSDDSSASDDLQVDSTSLNDIPGESRMALVVRTDLGMTKGKAAAQCAHAALGCYRLMQSDGDAHNPVLLTRWERTGQAKIALQVKTKDDMDELFARAISLNINAYVVHDAGRTQIEAGSATVLGLGPAPKSVLDEVTGGLKLY